MNVSFLTNSTSGWSNGLTLSNLDNKITSKVKKQKKKIIQKNTQKNQSSFVQVFQQMVYPSGSFKRKRGPTSGTTFANL